MKHFPAIAPPIPTRRLPAWLRPFARIESGLTWALHYPLLPAQMLFFMLIAWGGLGSGLGLFHLFWNETPLTQLGVGLAVGLLFGQLLGVRYLLDPGRRRFRLPPEWTLLPVPEPAVFRLGQYLLLFWPASLLLLAVPRFFRTDFSREPVPGWPVFAGLVLSVGVAVLIVLAIENLGIGPRAQRSMLFRALPGVRLGYIPRRDYPLHALAMVLTVVACVVFGGLWIAAHLGGWVLSPMPLVCLLLLVLNGLFGAISFHFRGFQYLVMLAVASVAVWANRDNDYKLTFPGLDYSPRARVRLDVDGQHDHYRELVDRSLRDAGRCGLIDSEEPLRALHERWQQAHPDQPGSRPKIILFAVSGGGIRAAVWTAVVLENLEREVPGLRDHVRLFAGASGGMLGAALYTADFDGTSPVGQRPWDHGTGLGPLSGLLAQDSLSRPVQRMMLSDLPGFFHRGPLEKDRGRELEEAWYDNTRPEPGEPSPLEKTFDNLRDAERHGLRPSLIFAPMMVEDARRLLISNLDLHALTETHASRLVGDDNRQPTRLLSLSAVEFRRLFPKARGFKVGTAARMSAAFPFVSPAVSLPTVPPRRVVDAGYYDNYGVHLAGLWMLHHEKALKEHTSGVALVEVRAYRNGFARRHFQDEDSETQLPEGPGHEPGMVKPRPDRGLFARLLMGISAPAQAILAARDRAACYRNDELLSLLDLRLNGGADRSFFTGLSFECDQDAALSWVLPSAEAAAIGRGFFASSPRRNAERLAQLKEWFGTGGRAP